MERLEAGDKRGTQLGQIGRRLRLRRHVDLARRWSSAAKEPDAGHEERYHNNERDGGDDPAAAERHDHATDCEKQAVISGFVISD